MLPSMLDWTMRISPFFNATMETCANALISPKMRDGDGANTHNQLDGISEGRVHQTADGLTHLDRQLLGREAQQRRKRDDGDEVLCAAVSNPSTAENAEFRRHTRTKTAVGFQSRAPAMMPSGTKTSRTLT